jgi:restriction endonuclease Mrr
LAELGQTDEGRLVQRRILGQLCNMRNLTDKDVPDRDGGLDALRALKQLALERDLVVRKSKQEQVDRALIAEQKERLLRERAERLQELHQQFTNAIISTDRQTAGYSLEDLLVRLFALFEIEYRSSYRTATQQIDGQFSFNGFHYLVEAKWRKERPTEQEIGGFKHKVDGKLESTRGIFISIPGFRPEVIDQFNGCGSNIILLDGTHLIHVLEGRIDLRDLLNSAIEKAAQEGTVYVPLENVVPKLRSRI